MSKKFTISIEQKKFTAHAGDVLLDAALRSGVELVHDCRVGHCGSCIVEITNDGLTIGGKSACGNIKACQARIFSDLHICANDAPVPARIAGQVTNLRHLGKRVSEVTITLRQPLHWLAGQYCNLQFRGYPARSFSPTAALRKGLFAETLTFHIKAVRNGAVTTAIGSKIQVGHCVTVEGPYGHAYLRKGRNNRLVLIGSGTGFAPIWAIACEALSENPDREIILICGARDTQSFYMAPALMFASRHRKVTVVPIIENPPRLSDVIYAGSPAAHLPKLDSEDIVYAAGSPKLVTMIEAVARNARCQFYADPFEAGPRGSGNNGSGALLQAWEALRNRTRRYV